MALTAFSGPLVVYGPELSPRGFTARSANQNPDQGPSLFYAGTGVLDPRPVYGYFPGGNPSPTAPNVCGFLSPDLIALDVAPATAATAAIAALQAPTANTALTLVAATGSGITVGASTVRQDTGATVTGLLQVDVAPNVVRFGSSGMIDIWDPTTLLTRAVSLTSAANLSAINFTVRGYDLYSLPQTEVIAGPNATTVNGKKTWKFISSVTPSATSASTVSVGTADVFGFPLRVDKFPYVYVYWNNIAGLVANFTAADTTSPATTATGDVRGSYSPPTASDGTKQLVVFITVPVANISSTTGMFGVTPV